jgi:hypothetical protein
MMWITVIETLVLSLIGIIVGCFEIYYLKVYLEYTEVKKRKDVYVLDSNDSGFDDEKDLDSKYNREDMTVR